MEKVGYTASSKKTENNANNAKIIIAVMTIFHTEFGTAIQETATELGYDVFFVYANSDGESGYAASLEAIKRIPREIIAGILIVNPDKPHNRYFDTFPMVQVGCSVDDYYGYGVMTDDIKAAHDMTAHLIKHGYRRIMVAPDVSSASDPNNIIKDRITGYKRALEKYHLPFEDSLLMSCDFSVRGGENLGRQILSMKERPEVIFCLTDVIAMGCMKALKSGGLIIPNDIAVAGFDHTEYSSYLDPALTTVSQSYDEIGMEAVRMLDQLIRGEFTRGRRLFVSHQIIEGQSILQREAANR
jgi:DNA-binding LacI/PurR family transcriptional regulator